MRHDAAATALPAIPVIDIAEARAGSAAGLARVAAEITRAAETVGFFYIGNHGVGGDEIARVFDVAHRFFHASDAEKGLVKVGAGHRGFIPVGEARMYEAAKVDLKESFIWGIPLAADDPALARPDAMLARNRWPAFLPEMERLLSAHLAACQTLGWLLLKAFATALEIAPDYFLRSVARPISRGSLIHYPPSRPELGGDQFGVAPHSDYGCLTLLCQDDVGGLELANRAGEWVAAPPIPGTFVVNVGDLLARWSNDRFQSTPHRVRNRSGRERFSVAVFVDPDQDTLIAPVVRPGETPHYGVVSCGSYIRSRFDEAFAYRKATA